MSLLRLGGNKPDEFADAPPLESSGGEIIFTARALHEVQQLLLREGGGLFRVGVSKGGCSGWNYEIDIAQAPLADDRVLDFPGDVRVVMSPKAIELVGGMRINYKASFQEQGFVFENPKAQSTCGCGISFGVS